jgi:hypothetical protein
MIVYIADEWRRQRRRCRAVAVIVTGNTCNWMNVIPRHQSRVENDSNDAAAAADGDSDSDNYKDNYHGRVGVGRKRARSGRPGAQEARLGNGDCKREAATTNERQH